MPEQPQKHRPFGEDGRVDPDSLTADVEEREAGPEGPTVDVVIRALSVIPFVLAAALGLIAIVSWVLIIVLGVGSGDPIWQVAKGLSAAELLWQLLLAILIAILPAGVTLIASWATVRGFREDSSRTFWTVVQGLWGLAIST